MVVTYVVPIVVMTITYARVGVELWGSQSIGECTQRQMENIRSKRRVSFVRVECLSMSSGLQTQPAPHKLLSKLVFRLFNFSFQIEKVAKKLLICAH